MKSIMMKSERYPTPSISQPSFPGEAAPEQNSVSRSYITPKTSRKIPSKIRLIGLDVARGIIVLGYMVSLFFPTSELFELFPSLFLIFSPGLNLGSDESHYSRLTTLFDFGLCILIFIAGISAQISHQKSFKKDRYIRKRGIVAAKMNRSDPNEAQHPLTSGTGRAANPGFVSGVSGAVPSLPSHLGGLDNDDDASEEIQASSSIDTHTATHTEATAFTEGVSTDFEMGEEKSSSNDSEDTFPSPHPMAQSGVMQSAVHDQAKQPNPATPKGKDTGIENQLNADGEEEEEESEQDSELELETFLREDDPSFSMYTTFFGKNSVRSRAMSLTKFVVLFVIAVVVTPILSHNDIIVHTPDTAQEIDDRTVGGLDLPCLMWTPLATFSLACIVGCIIDMLTGSHFTLKLLLGLVMSVQTSLLSRYADFFEDFTIDTYAGGYISAIIGYSGCFLVGNTAGMWLFVSFINSRVHVDEIKKLDSRVRAGQLLSDHSQSTFHPPEKSDMGVEMDNVSVGIAHSSAPLSPPLSANSAVSKKSIMSCGMTQKEIFAASAQTKRRVLLEMINLGLILIIVGILWSIIPSFPPSAAFAGPGTIFIGLGAGMLFVSGCVGACDIGGGFPYVLGAIGENSSVCFSLSYVVSLLDISDAYESHLTSLQNSLLQVFIVNICVCGLAITLKKFGVVLPSLLGLGIGVGIMIILLPLGALEVI
ncbi:hypothetical protein ADUPG1_008683 [Aduncisulcus paluster]|uniref:Uncharacterized protein n=1 Tax=Aduncisulcus paluster TaxID=2918883 RepID=A0ABQ5KSW0_9EUKA|nr:hypothetical protein ADUPG1_008683 [Aduncisulcus paluster]